MKKQPLVSVGIPTYNRPKGLFRTLQCITSQTYKNLQIIVSDNCSPNSEVKKVVKIFQAKDNRIIYFRQSKNILGKNLEFVLKKASAKYFMWAADDDSWKPEYISNCMKEFSKSKKIILVSTACCFVDPSRKKPNFIDYGIDTYKLSVYHRFKIFRQAINNRYFTNSIFYGIYKKNILKETLPFINVLASDHLLMFKICLSGEIITIPVVNFLRRRGGASQSFAKTAAIMKIKNPLLIKCPFFIREILIQKIIWQSKKINLFEKISISFFSFFKYLDKFTRSFINQNIIKFRTFLR